MTNEVAVRHGSGLDITPDQDFWSDKQLAALKQLGIQDASNGDLAVFMHVAQRTGLDPFARQIYMIKRFTKDGPRQTIQTGIDGFRLVARRAADRAGDSLSYEPTMWAGADGEWRDVWLEEGPPAAARVVVLRNGEPFPAVAHWREYVQTNKDGSPTVMWAKMSAHMLAKVTEVLALRKAYPHDLAGIYSPDEYRDDPPAQPPRRVTAAEIRREPPEISRVLGDEPDAVDPVTGEVQDWPPVTQPAEPT